MLKDWGKLAKNYIFDFSNIHLKKMLMFFEYLKKRYFQLSKLNLNRKATLNTKTMQKLL